MDYLNKKACQAKRKCGGTHRVCPTKLPKDEVETTNTKGENKRA
jgi:hypothetical protein